MKANITRPVVTIRFALPKPELRPFITTYYRTELVTSPSEPVVEDWLHPEWPNLRFTNNAEARAAVGSAPLEPCAPFTVSGPTSHATRFEMTSGTAWGIGLMPLGWAALMLPQAGDYADRFVDGMSDPAFEMLHPLSQDLANERGEFDAELALIERHMDWLDWRNVRATPTIQAINATLLDPELATVADFAARVGVSVRSLERVCRRAFGFTPKLLLRRQRFLRSLGQFMLDPSMKWLNALDFQYHDQAHFVRDFKRFMGMNPTAYAKLDKPMLIAAARARSAIAGEAIQGLHKPTDAV